MQSVNVYMAASRYTFNFPKNSVEIYSPEDIENDPQFSQHIINLSLDQAVANIAIGTYIKGQSELYSEEDIEKYNLYIPITIGAHKGYRNEGIGTGGAWFSTTVFFGNKYIYEIQYSSESRNQKYENILNGIVETFAWTK